MYLTQKWSVKIKTFLRRFWLKRQRNGTVWATASHKVDETFTGKKENTKGIKHIYTRNEENKTVVWFDSSVSVSGLLPSLQRYTEQMFPWLPVNLITIISSWL